MRFIVDENMGPSIARWLLAQGHEVFSVYDQAQGIYAEVIQGKFTVVTETNIRII